MPHRKTWVEPELVVEHMGTKVWRTYPEDDVDQGSWNYWYTLDMDCGDEECGCAGGECERVFDVSELPTWQPGWRHEPSVVKQAIIAAIESGHLRTPPAKEAGG